MNFKFILRMSTWWPFIRHLGQILSLMWSTWTSSRMTMNISKNMNNDIIKSITSLRTWTSQPNSIKLHNYILIVTIAPSFQFDRLTWGYIWIDNLCEMLYPGLVCVLLTLCTRVMITLPISRYGQSWVTRNQETYKEKKICQQLLLINQLIY